MKSNIFEAIKRKLNAFCMILGTRMLIFSHKHPFIFTQIIIITISIIATIISTLVGR